MSGERIDPAHDRPSGPGGIDVAVHVRPGGRRDEVEGSYDGVLAVRVTAPATEGRANDAVCRVLADAFGVPHYDVKVVVGRVNRRKRVRVGGDPDRLNSVLQVLMGSGED